jgi:hypothetical protein
MAAVQHEVRDGSPRRRAARPTLRVLKCDLHLPVPPIGELLEDIDHPLLAKARDQFAVDDAAHERIRAIDNEVVWKVKIRRWRGAVWTDEHIPWLWPAPGALERIAAPYEAPGRRSRLMDASQPAVAELGGSRRRSPEARRPARPCIAAVVAFAAASRCT